jgi:protease I
MAETSVQPAHLPWTAAADRSRRGAGAPAHVVAVGAEGPGECGATWIDDEVVVDRNLITSRKSDDLDAFCDAVLKALAR